MKKFILSSIVVISFVIYSVIARNQTPAMPVIAIHKQMPIVTPTIQVTNSSSVSPTGTPVGTNTPTATQTAVPTPTASSKYKNGTYTGIAADALYGNIQVQATIANGKITNVIFLQAPSDRATSVYINSQADSALAQEAIQAQSANVNVISGATDSTDAFIQSLQSALNQAS